MARELKVQMLRMATRFGDPHPTSMTAVATTQDAALLVVAPGHSVPGSDGRFVYLVLMTGNFTLGRGSPVARRLVTGRYLNVVLDQSTFRLTDRSLGDRPPSVALETLGPVSDLSE